jgi:hypothetical protein
LHARNPQPRHNLAPAQGLLGWWALENARGAVEHLLPVGLVVGKEYIAKLGKACQVIQVQFFWCMNELGDRFIESKLDYKLTVILMDFGLILVTRIVALQLVDLGSTILVSQQHWSMKQGFFL